MGSDLIKDLSSLQQALGVAPEDLSSGTGVASASATVTPISAAGRKPQIPQGTAVGALPGVGGDSLPEQAVPWAVPKGSNHPLSDLLSSASIREQLRGCVSHPAYDVDRVLARVRTRMTLDARLAECDPRSVVGAIMTSADLGLMPDFDFSGFGHGYVALRRASQSQASGAGFAYEASFIPGYRGLIALMMRSGAVKSVVARVVTDQEIATENFSLIYEAESDTLVHRPILIGQRGQPALAYCRVIYNNGGSHIEPMRKDEIEAIKSFALDRVQVGDESPWVYAEEEMWRKCPVRRAANYVSLDAEHLRVAVNLDKLHELGRSQQMAQRFDCGPEYSVPHCCEAEPGAGANGAQS